MSEMWKSRRGAAVERERAWRRQVERSLHGRQFEAFALASVDGLRIEAIYGRPDQTLPISTRSADAPWRVVQRIDDPDIERSRAALAADLAGGVDGVTFVFSESAAARRAGFGINPLQAPEILPRSDKSPHITIDAGEATYAIFKTFSSENSSVTLAYDPLAHAAASGGWARALSEIERDVVAAAKSLEAQDRPGAAAIADGRIWAAGGASEAQELSAVLGSLNYLTRVLVGGGMPPEIASRRVAIALDAGANQTLTIAKFRAMRLLHARFIEAFGLSPCKADIHAETSWRMMTRLDIHTNILRAACAGFAAGIGGADSITVLPFTTALGLPDDFARRVARNSQALSIHEAGIARVGDPAAGSGAVESLTNTLADAAWKRFQEIEAAGGLLDALRSGSIQRDIAGTRLERNEKIARGAIKIVGVSAYPSLDEVEIPTAMPDVVLPSIPPPESETIAQLAAERLSAPLEALRARAAALAKRGYPPGIFIAAFGAPSDLREIERAAASFFAIGGIHASATAGFNSPEAAAGAFVASGLRAACIVGSGEFTRRLVGPSAAALKAQGAIRVYFAGDRETDVSTSIANVDAMVGNGVNAVEILDDLLSILEEI
jgi:methylmalonyl-CoA mutase